MVTNTLLNTSLYMYTSFSHEWNDLVKQYDIKFWEILPNTLQIVFFSLYYQTTILFQRAWFPCHLTNNSYNSSLSSLQMKEINNFLSFSFQSSLLIIREVVQLALHIISCMTLGRYLISPCLGFLVCKLGIIVTSASWRNYEGIVG